MMKHATQRAFPCLVLGTLIAGCPGSDFLGLEDYQRDLITGGLLADALLDGNRAGIACWDRNGNGRNDPEEDVNGDGGFDTADCITAAGQELPLGISCWDTNGNGVADFGGTESEDTNGDGTIDAFDCRGPAGADGTPGPAGLEGTPGLNCWDLNGNGRPDPSEDQNRDGAFDALDCRGPVGPPGAVGSTGRPGEPGPSLFHVFVDDFFTAGGFGDLVVVSVGIREPVLGQDLAATGNGSDAIAFRVAIPQVYDEGNDVTMRVHLYRTGTPFEPCLILQLDARRLRNGDQVSTYGSTRWIRVETPENSNPSPAGRPPPADVLLTLDLPLNTGDGLGFPNDLQPADFLAFEVRSFAADGAIYELVAVEFFELSAGESLLTGATVFHENGKEEPGCE